MFRVPDHEHLQLEAKECGLACISYVATRHGADLTLSEIRSRHGSEYGRLSVSRLIEIARLEGYLGTAYKAHISDCVNIAKPAILLFEQNHYVVLIKIRRKQFHIFDPALGRLIISAAEFQERYSQVAIELSPIQNFKPKPSQPRMQFRSLIGLDSHAKKSLIGIAILSVGVQVSTFVSPLFVKSAIDNGLKGHDLQLLTAIAVGFLTLSFANFFSEIFRSMLTQKLALYLEYNIGANLINRLLSMPSHWIERRSTSDVFSRFDSVRHIATLVSSQIAVCIIDICIFSFVGIYILISEPFLAGIAASAIVLCLTAELIFVAISFRYETRSLLAKISEQSVRLEIIQKFSSIKSQFEEIHLLNKWTKLKYNSLTSSYSSALTKDTKRSINRLMSNSVTIIAAWIGINYVTKGDFSLGSLYIFITYFNIYLSRGYGLISQLTEWRLISIHTGRLADIALAPVSTPAENEIRINRPLVGHVDMRNCYYSDGLTGAPILKGLSMHVREGQSVSIQGARGSGKTTLARAMGCTHGRFQGDYRVGELPPTMWSNESLRKGIGIVLGSDAMLNGTIAQNISRFADTIDTGRLGHVCRVVGAESAILTLPQQYNTLISDLNIPLSDAVIDRIYIARALYHRPKLIIIDSRICEIDLPLLEAVRVEAKSLCATLFVFHNRAEINESCDLAFRLDGGTLRGIGSRRLQDVNAGNNA